MFDVFSWFSNPVVPVVIIACLLAVLVLVVVVAARSGGVRAHERVVERWREDSERWASPRDVRDLVVPARDPLPEDHVGRLWIGEAHGKQLYAPKYHSVLVMGPAGSGKTGRVMVREVVEWPGPAAVGSVKGDLLQLTASARAKHGSRTLVVDPTGLLPPIPGVTRCAYSPLYGVRSYGDVERVAKSLAESSKASDPSGDIRGQRFWDQESSYLLAPLLWAAHTHGYSLPDVAGWVKQTETDDSEIQSLILATGHPKAIEDWLHFKGLPARETKSSVAATAAVVLAAWGKEEVADTVSIRGDRVAAGFEILDIPRFLASDADTLYLVSPGDVQNEFTAIFETILNEVLRHIQLLSHSLGGIPIPHPVLVAVDEAANVAPIRNLDTVLTTVRGMGVCVLTAWQDMGQISAFYGRDRAMVIVSNHLAQIYLTGAMLNQETLEMVSRAVGQDSFEEVSTSSSRYNGPSDSTSYRLMDVAPVWWLQHLPDDVAVVIMSRHPAVRAIVPAYWEDKKLLAKIPKDVSTGFANQYRSGNRTRGNRRRPPSLPGTPTGDPGARVLGGATSGDDRPRVLVGR